MVVPIGVAEWWFGAALLGHFVLEIVEFGFERVGARLRKIVRRCHNCTSFIRGGCAGDGRLRRGALVRCRCDLGILRTTGEQKRRRRKNNVSQIPHNERSRQPGGSLYDFWWDVARRLWVTIGRCNQSWMA